MSRKDVILKRTALIICFFLFAFRAGAQTDGTDTSTQSSGTDTSAQSSGTVAPVCNDLQECVDAAQASADDAAAKQQAALETQNDAQATLDKDVGNGACDAQIQDDKAVL
jgi:hypothetical protein